MALYFVSWRWFERGIMACILMSSVMLAVVHPADPDSAVVFAP